MIEETLKERGNRYGAFETHAEIAQDLKMTLNRYGDKLDTVQREALDMAMHKIARILNGDPDYIDSWRDCIGFLQLVINHLDKKDGATDSVVTILERRDASWVDETMTPIDKGNRDKLKQISEYDGRDMKEILHLLIATKYKRIFSQKKGKL